MKNYNNNNNNKVKNNSSSSSSNNGYIPNSLKFISSCIKTVSTNVRSASASVASSISGDSDSPKDQVIWASFDRLELSPSSFKHVLLLGYSNGFQVLDVEDASNVSELVSRRDNPVTFLQMQPIPAKSEGHEGFKTSHPLLLVVAGDEPKSSYSTQSGRDGVIRDVHSETQAGNFVHSPTAVRFYSLRSHSYVHVLRFRSTVYMVRCSPRVVAVGLATQIYCFDALTLENKFSVLTYPVPQLGAQGMVGINIGYGPMAVGPRWLAYASNNPLSSNTGRLSPQSLTPSPGVSPSTSPGSGNLVARYAMESSKQLAVGLINLGDMGYKTLSKYCQELLPDGSNSPVSSNSIWKVGRPHSSETDTAGMVVVKDFVSRAVVSQFRAHTSPISALCFDPSGTLLVTASIHGNNINIFRIMPSCSHNGSGNQSYDWSSSHVHLYKLHRGMTSAVIQDICFSNYSQWITIVSSKGTCHVFILSPFGGDTSLQIQNCLVDRPTLLPVLCQPWWSTASFMVNQHSFPRSPPLPITLNVVSRIKDGNSGWLNTVSNAASSAAGKLYVPSGAVAAVFHNSIPYNVQPAQLGVNTLEHLLAYTPSGHVIQYKLLPSMGGEQSETAARHGSGSLVAMQDEDLKVKVEPIQWWDVCRRTDWPEREQCISGITLERIEGLRNVMDTSDCEHSDIAEKDMVKPQERSHWYLSNAEVQISSGRIPIWQNSKIYFYTMGPLVTHEHTSTKDNSTGGIEIEKVPVHEVEIKRKDLLPVFNHVRRIQSGWSDRGLAGAKYSSLSSDPHEAKDEFVEGVLISHSKLVPHGLVENSDGGSSRTSRNMLDLHQMDTEKFYQHVVQTENENVGQKRVNALASSLLNQSSFNSDSVTLACKQSTGGVSPVENSPAVCSLLSLEGGLLSVGRNISKIESSNSVKMSDVSNASSNSSRLIMNTLDEGPVQHMDFEQYFHEEYCKASALNESQELAEVVTEMDSSSSPCDRDKSEEDGDDDNDELLGAVFSFSEEG